jgi:DNA-binding MarR family transcriptional regulator
MHFKKELDWRVRMKTISRVSKNRKSSIPKNAIVEVSKILSHSTRCSIVIILYIEAAGLPFSEIKSVIGTHISSPDLSHHLRILEKQSVLKNERKLDTSSGKARTSFYRLTEEGREIIAKLGQIICKKKNIEADLSGSAFYLMQSVMLFPSRI